ncbi:MAG: RNA 3'-terminal phosphate cyclase [Methyloceanibacter sp.]
MPRIVACSSERPIEAAFSGFTRNKKITSHLIIDGAHGEGGGQILRTALSLSAVTSRAFRLVNIRAKRRNPGLQPQHLSATRAAGAISGAQLAGDFLGSSELVFTPTHPPQPGSYLFDVAEIAGHGSAGSTILILQTVLVPLALAQGDSTVVVLGGTHQDWAPAYDDLANAYLPALRRMGLSADAELKRWGWYPAGGGEVVCKVKGDPASRRAAWPQPVEALERGPLIRISGRAVAANLPAHIAQRMADRARAGLNDLDVPVQIEPLRVRAVCPGAGIFLLADYETLVASFSAHGRQGKPSEAVADEAVAALRGHHVSGAAVELHLADQLLLPLAIAAGPSAFTMARPTAHLATNAWTIEQFALAKITVEPGLLTRVQVLPSPANAS